MTRKPLIALAALAAAGLAFATAAEAKTKIHFGVGVNLGGPVYVGGGYGYPYYDYYGGDYLVVSEGPDCHWMSIKHKKWNASHTKKIVYFTKEYVCG